MPMRIWMSTTGSSPASTRSATRRASVVLHPQGGAHGTIGVVLVGDGRPEEGDDGVAENLVDAAAEGLDLAHEGLEVRLDEPGHGLGVEVLGERCVADEVGEQHGDDPAFLDRDRRTLHGSPARRTEA